MEAIREEDRGTETMVFEMTSIQLNSELQFCLGNAYEHNGKDRYNVYLVKNGRVHGCIGHYDVPLGEPTVDAGGKDFDVMKYKEPSWTIDPSFHLLEKGKPEKEKEKKDRATPKPPPKAKSLFRVIITADDGNCFYDTLVRSKDGNDVEDYNAKKVEELRKELGEYITTTGKETLLEKYHYSVEAVSGKPFSMKNDPYYGKYYARKEKGESEDTIIADIQKELENPAIEGKLDPEKFRTHKGDDPSVNTYNETDNREAARHFLNDYFQNEMALSDVDIVEVFKENIETDKVWVSELIILQAEKKYNVKFLLLKKGGADAVEQYAPDDLDTYKVIDAETKFIMVEYTPLEHFKLIVQDKKKRFSMDEVPAVIKAKFAMFEGQVPQVVAAAQDAQQEKLETPAVEVDSAADASDEDSGPKYTKEKLEKMSNKQLEDILKAEFEGVPVSTLKGKPELIECILNPEQEMCKRKKPVKKPTVAPDASAAPTPPGSPSAAPAASVGPITYTREQLDKMTKGELEKIMMQISPNVSISSIGKQGKQGVIDCILNPEQEKCQSKKAKKGGNYTRKQARQLA